ncbi:MAG TPA: hypothetical protein VF773_15390 [Verrucomicrobiae bacterium]
MKTPQTIAAFVLSSSLLVGCAKQDDATPAASATNTSASTTDILKEKASEVAATVKEQTKEVTQAAQETAAKIQAETATQTKAVQEKLGEQASTVETKVKAVVAKAQQLYSEGKFNDAMTSLNTLASDNLSVENQAVVARLKEQVQAALQGAANLTDKANKTVGGLLQPQQQ